MIKLSYYNGPLDNPYSVLECRDFNSIAALKAYVDTFPKLNTWNYIDLTEKLNSGISVEFENNETLLKIYSEDDDYYSGSVSLKWLVDFIKSHAPELLEDEREKKWKDLNLLYRRQLAKYIVHFKSIGYKTGLEDDILRLQKELGVEPSIIKAN